MNNLIDSNLNTLNQLHSIINQLDNRNLSNKTVEPYKSSIGSHIRHILDFYYCILFPESEIIDFTKRKRDEKVESCCVSAKAYLNQIIEALKTFEYNDKKAIIVKDDLGLGLLTMTYTYDAVLSQANSHTIHHFAIINYIMNALDLKLYNSKFGYNPTTVIEERR
ncbi:hypothetical protein [Mangrovimonas spongiae]|uniref:DinB family protein n=1 Tax=Mangrovimonas spongiae TaxID=2494697 RepID=A0A3R9ME84_9FLAO|nr:hypothetical protein [Mangrovimonas spongiae]RSK38321.1 hypothetical protein EJA19_12575 [Mangrovimonas spongiae]